MWEVTTHCHWVGSRSWGAQPEVLGELELAQRCPGLQLGWGHLFLRLSDTQVTLNAVEGLRTDWGPAGWIWPGAKGEKKEAPTSSSGMSPSYGWTFMGD